MINDEDYLKICEIIAAKSHSTRNKVGAVIVKDGNVISFGYNGTPSRFDNACENENGVTKPEVLHAESNAILKCACSVNSSEGATLYTLLSPCFECAKLIIQARIARVVYRDFYRDISGIYLLNKAGILTDEFLNIPTSF